MVRTGNDKRKDERKPYISKSSFQILMVGPGGFEPPLPQIIDVDSIFLCYTLIKRRRMQQKRRR